MMHSLAALFLVALIAALCLVATSATWVDPDSPPEVQTASSHGTEDNRTVYQLVFSDEFQVVGRTFHDGNDPRWTAMNKNDFTNNPLHYYSHDNVHTNNGMLNITTEIEPKNFTTYDVDAKNYSLQYKEVKSGMLQSWNKFCFTGGIVEFSARLPGSPTIGGLWPAIWMMGNLARATYVNSSEHLWPFSTNVCDNQTRHSQLINSCPGNDNYKYNLPENRGRGAPEVDLLEVMYMDVFENPLMSSSLQVAPGIEKHRPVPGHAPNSSQTWYPRIKYGNISSINTYFYGTTVWQKRHPAYKTDAISANTYVRDDHFYRQHIYRVEWEPPSMEDGSGGYLKWFMDGKLIASVHGDALQETSQTEIPSEPMYLLMNTAISKDWGFPDAWFLNCKCKCWSCFDPCCQCGLPKNYCTNFPATFEIDYVRVYQNPNDSRHTLGCSPPLRPTADFIEARKKHYKLPHEQEPLLPVVEGGGACVTDDDCGTLDRGKCSPESSTCVCSASWTGPQCLAHAGSDEEEEEETQDDDQPLPEEENAKSFDVPLFCACLAAAALLAGTVYLRWKRNRHHRASYEKLADNGNSMVSMHQPSIPAQDNTETSSSHSSLSYHT